MRCKDNSRNGSKARRARCKLRACDSCAQRLRPRSRLRFPASACKTVVTWTECCRASPMQWRVAWRRSCHRTVYRAKPEHNHERPLAHLAARRSVCGCGDSGDLFSKAEAEGKDCRKYRSAIRRTGPPRTHHADSDQPVGSKGQSEDVLGIR